MRFPKYHMMVPSVAVPIAFTDIVKVMERIFTQDIGKNIGGE